MAMEGGAMRISELSAVSGISIPTINFYRREGLLPAGTPTAVNQADYDEAHLHRLQVIRALTEIGRVRLRDVRRIVEAIDDERLPLHDLLGVAQYALEGADDQAAAPPERADERVVDAALESLGWHVKPDAPARRSLARALASLRELGWEPTPQMVARYGAAIDALAAAEVA